MTRLLARLPFDTYLLLLVLTVGLAAMLPVRGVGAEIMRHVVYAAIALLFFLYGAKLSSRAVVDGLLHWRLQLLVFASTYVLFPLLGLAIAVLARGHIADELLTGLLFLAVLPSTVQSSIALTSLAGGNVPAALTCASVSNIIGVVLTPLLVGLVLSASPAAAGVGLGAIGNIALQLLLPFILGQLARPLIGGFLGRHRALTGLVDRGVILLVVYAAFSAGMVAGIWSRVGWTDLLLVALIAGALLALVLTLLALAGRALGFRRADRITAAFCGSQKTMATGIPMAGVLFAAAAVPLIVLPLMLYHQLQLFACTFLAQRHARIARAEASAAAARTAATGGPAGGYPAA